MHLRTLFTTSRFANGLICLYGDSSRALQLHSLVHHYCNVGGVGWYLQHTNKS